jgi:cysteinyl-tRNA synthetase
MGKSLGNFITLNEFFSGQHALLEQAYSPMTIRFFILQAHYRSTVDFSNEALKAAEKAYKRIINGLRSLKALQHPGDSDLSINQELVERIETASKEAFEGMNDDLNSAVALASIFELLRIINSFKNGQFALNSIGSETFHLLRETYRVFVEDIFGLLEEKGKSPQMLDHLMSAILTTYQNAKDRKDYPLVDQIRAQIKSEGIVIKDSKTGITWDYEE